MKLSLKFQKRIDHWIGTALIALVRIPTVLLGIVLRRSHQLNLKNEILFIKLMGGGSLFIAYPALLALRNRHPEVKFRIMCSREIRGFVELSGLFDEISEVDSSSALKLIASGITCWWRNFRVDTVVDLEIHSKLTTIFSVLLCSRNRIGAFMGWNRWKNGLTTHSIFASDNIPISEFYAMIAEIYGVPRLPYAAAAEVFQSRFGPRVLPPADGTVHWGMACFSSDLCPEREFKVDEWIQILERDLLLIKAPKVRAELFGGPKDRMNADLFCERLNQHFHGRIEFRHRCGQLSLRESALTVRGLDRFYTIDSGLNHIARLFEVEISSFWGPTEPRRLLQERGFGIETIHYRKVLCSPCVHLVATPPCLGNNVCMKSHVTQSNPRVQDMPWLFSVGSRNG